MHLVPIFLIFVVSLQSFAAADEQPIHLEISRSSIAQSSQKWIWFQARTAYVKNERQLFVTTMSQTWNDKTHDYRDVYQTISRDGGATWSPARAIPSLRLQTTLAGYEVAPADLWPKLHANSGTILTTGVTFHFSGGSKEHHLRQQVAYAVMDPQTSTWGPLQVLALPKKDHQNQKILAASAGCSQRVDLSDGDILLPVRYFQAGSFTGKETFDYSDSNIVYHSIVVRCGFDGQRLKYKEHGTELTLSKDESHKLAKRRGVQVSGRGLYEPSLTRFQGKYYMTLRSDHSAFVTKGTDGIHFEPAREWTFDDGQWLGSYCTQQHWLTAGGGLFLVYTRTGANNGHVFRHRAPLFIAQVDPDHLHVIRATERVVFPENHAALGNFGICPVSQSESWVTVGERTEIGKRKGKQSHVLLAKITAVHP